MTDQITDSPLRCPYCHKRMLLRLDQNRLTFRLRQTHECWSCGHTEIDTARPRRGTNTAAIERLARMRLDG